MEPKEWTEHSERMDILGVESMVTVLPAGLFTLGWSFDGSGVCNLLTRTHMTTESTTSRKAAKQINA
jgi:hypothetical protein